MDQHPVLCNRVVRSSRSRGLVAVAENPRLDGSPPSLLLPPGSPRLLTSPPSVCHLLSAVSLSAWQAVPGVTLQGNGLLIASQEDPAFSTHPITLPLPHQTHTHIHTETHTALMHSPQREIVLERQGSRAEVQMRRVGRNFPQL